MPATAVAREMDPRRKKIHAKELVGTGLNAAARLKPMPEAALAWVLFAAAERTHARRGSGMAGAAVLVWGSVPAPSYQLTN